MFCELGDCVVVVGVFEGLGGGAVAEGLVTEVASFEV